MKATELSIKLGDAMEKETEPWETLVLTVERVYISKAFLVVGTIATLLLHMLLVVPTILLFKFVGNIYGTIFAVFTAIVSSQAYGLFIISRLIKLVRMHLQEQFHIKRGITGNVVLMFVALALIAATIVVQIAISLVPYHIGYALFYVQIAFEVALIIVVAVDFFM